MEIAKMYEEQMNESYNNFQKLKANVHTHALMQYVLKVKEVWKPKKKLFTGMHNHGSKADDEETFMIYWDEYNCVWTNKEKAFQGHLFKKIIGIMNENKIEKFKEK